MRERLLAAFVGLTLLTVLLYGIPRVLARVDLVNEDARSDVQRSAEVVAEAIGLRRQVGSVLPALPPSYLGPEDIVVLVQDGTTRVIAALGSAGQRPDDVRAVVPLSGGGTVEVRRPRSVVRGDVLSAVRPILVTGLVALTIAVVAAFLLAARLARPFQALAAGAATLGRGEAVELPPLRVREAETIAGALRLSSVRVASMLQRERDFARNASHQLRTPLTAMRLRLDDLTAWPETAPEVGKELVAVLEEVDRLGDTVTTLLAFARQGDLGAWQDVDPTEVAAAAAARWSGLATALGREVEVDGRPGDLVGLPRVVVDQVLDVLVDNALKHGAGKVVVGVAADANAVRFCVQDQGTDAPPAEQLFTRRARSAAGEDGEGLGLALCADLASVMGGRLLLSERHPTTFALVLPATRP